ncbi:DMT family transporter [Amaricoccus sp.]|uniref:DMT family transporter n=1 Tax=Amaricoccus sp. TaxID=1872485 RepID=UPI001B715969|nr:DMT family transporter [Amaricoccus sp.]MBP7242466.1 DMT family transporter [Amaricoccus sp.]
MPAPFQPDTARRAQRLGIAIAFLGMLMFALNDVMGKWLVATYSVGQVLLLRSVAALVVLAPVLWTRRVRLWPLERPWMQLLRAAASTLEVWCFYYAVSSLPLADVMTYWLAGPIYVAAASPLVLGERIGPWRWGAILVGFAGVVVALRPGAQTLDPAVLVSLFGSTMFAVMVLGARMLRATPDGALVFWQIAGALVAGLATAWHGWTPPTVRDVGLLSLLGVVAMGAHLLIARSLKLADAGTIAPMEYTLLLWAILFGWVFFSDVPEPVTLVGAALITASGLGIWLRESQAAPARRRRRRPPDDGVDPDPGGGSHGRPAARPLRGERP